MPANPYLSGPPYVPSMGERAGAARPSVMARPYFVITDILRAPLKDKRDTSFVGDPEKWTLYQYPIPDGARSFQIRLKGSIWMSFVAEAVPAFPDYGQDFFDPTVPPFPHQRQLLTAFGARFPNFSWPAYDGDIWDCDGISSVYFSSGDFESTLSLLFFL